MYQSISPSACQLSHNQFVFLLCISPLPIEVSVGKPGLDLEEDEEEAEEGNDEKVD